MNLKVRTTLGVLVLSLILHPVDRPRLSSPANARKRITVDLEKHARTCADDFPIILDAARESRIDARIVAAVIVVETWNRPLFRRFIEIRTAEILSLASAIIGTSPADFSIGPGQIKLTTALWVKRNFHPLRRRGRERLSDQLADIEYVARPQENIRLVAQYLSHLAARRYAKNGTANLDPDQVRVVATEYHVGMRPISKHPTDRYGEIVAELACSGAVADLLLQAGRGMRTNTESGGSHH